MVERSGDLAACLGRTEEGVPGAVVRGWEAELTVATDAKGGGGVTGGGAGVGASSDPWEEAALLVPSQDGSSDLAGGVW